MKLGLFSGKGAVYKKEGKKIAKILKERGVDFEVYEEVNKVNCDILIIVGGDGTILKVVRSLEEQVPILGVSRGLKFLTEVKFSEFEKHLKRLLEEDYKLEERMRLSCKINGRELPDALNEVLVTTSKGGGAIKHTLNINDKLVWRDNGDGVIVATPTGSTAYSLSAGGPVVIENASTISIVPICSMNDNKPLIVNDKSKVDIDNIFSTSGCEVVIDGQKRFRVKGKNLRIEKSDEPALFVRFSDEHLRLFGKLRDKKERIVLPDDAPPSAKLVFKVLSYEGALTQKEIIDETKLPSRTTRYALNYLLENGIIEKRTNLKDTRQSLYFIME